MTEIFAPKTKHFNARRATILIIHGTEADDETSRALLSGKTEKQGSAHYYIDDKGNVEQYLDETARAWHAGISYWAGNTDINSLSIGIELMSLSQTRKFDGPDTFYTDAQMQALGKLAKAILERNKIPAWHVLSHQDIACTRELEPIPGDTVQEMMARQNIALEKKYDPGPSFNWKLLADSGIGLWHGLEPVKNDAVHTDSDTATAFRTKLALYGYDTRPHKNQDFASVIRAFQTHFLPWNICGQVTEQSIKALDILLEKKYEQS